MNYSETTNLQGKRVAILTLGCKVNSYESDAIAGQFKRAGAELVDFDEAVRTRGGADVFVINTCSVTNIADRKSRQMLHRVRQLNPTAVIAATGCYAQLAGERLIDSEEADLVIGNSHKSELVRLTGEYFKYCRMSKAQTAEGQELNEQQANADSSETKGSEATDSNANDSNATESEATGIFNVCLTDPMTREKRYEQMCISDCEERTRAFIKIEDGCNQFCTYCIIPYARGRVRSRSQEDIVAEVTGLAAKGYREVVLTGIHVSSYGCDDYEHTDGFRYEPLLSLIKAVAEINGIDRIRLGSLEPRIITEQFAEELAAIPQFCPHFHLSLQSGCNSVLERMHRHYTAEEYMEVCRILRASFDRPSINTDVIVGFPGETEEEFTESKEFLRQVNFAKMHIFKYSRRQGTKADRMPGQQTEAVKHARSEELMLIDSANHRDYMASFDGEVHSVLFERVLELNGQCYTVGLTDRYVEVAVPVRDESADMINTIRQVRMCGFLNDECMLGEMED